MAEIVIGVAASHTPQLSSGVDMWPDHAERDRRNPQLVGIDGEFHTYEDLLATVDPSVAAQLTDKVWAEKYERAQRGIDIVTEQLAQARVDVAVVIGDDQWELFRDEGLPVFGLYTGESLFDEPVSAEVAAALPPGMKAAQWARHGVTRTDHSTDGELAEHIVATLAAAEFDIFKFSSQHPERSLGHAFTFPRYRLGLSTDVPIVPLFINTYIPPNVPSAKRCFDLGSAMRQAIESYERDLRVAVITSGGLSHFVINEQLDKQVLDGLTAGDFASFGDMPRKLLRSGNSEILNWIAAAGVLEKLDATVVDYIPGYRSPAGTGTAMAFAYWK